MIPGGPADRWGASATTMGDHLIRRASSRHSVDWQGRARPKRRRADEGSGSREKTTMATWTRVLHGRQNSAFDEMTCSPSHLVRKS
jgi:hypothetical protein